jgi:8-oxo-dGTP pyrophosphatase MutT (NUDIX family)
MIHSPDLIPAASLVILRYAENEFEILLVKRNPKLAYMGGAWVFPGGRIEKKDFVYLNDGRLAAAAVHSAVRETHEECGLTFLPSTLIPLSQWITPPGMPRRFSTYFFLTMDTGGDVTVDGGEILQYQWLTPKKALDAQRSGDMVLPPPNFVTLIHLARHTDAQSVLSYYRRRTPEIYKPRLVPVPGGLCSVHNDDVSYDGSDLSQHGRKHRLLMVDSGWEYHCDGMINR